MKHEPTHSEGNCSECLIIIYEVMLFLCETFQVSCLSFLGQRAYSIKEVSQQTIGGCVRSGIGFDDGQVP